MTNSYQYLGTADSATVQEGIKAGTGILHDIISVFAPAPKTNTNPGQTPTSATPLVIQQPSGMSGTTLALFAFGGIALLGTFVLLLRPRSHS